MDHELTADWTAYTALILAASLFAGFWVLRYVTTQPRGHYLTAALGQTRHLTRVQRVQYWKQAVRYISRLIRLRKHWSTLGRHLRTPRIRDLVSGIARHRGTLRRESAAAIN